MLGFIIEWCINLTAVEHCPHCYSIKILTSTIAYVSRSLINKGSAQQGLHIWSCKYVGSLVSNAKPDGTNKLFFGCTRNGSFTYKVKCTRFTTRLDAWPNIFVTLANSDICAQSAPASCNSSFFSCANVQQLWVLPRRHTWTALPLVYAVKKHSCVPQTIGNNGFQSTAVPE